MIFKLPKEVLPLLTIKGLRDLWRFVAVSDFSMDVHSGRLKALLANGAGKTTIVI